MVAVGSLIAVSAGGYPNPERGSIAWNAVF